MKQQFKVFRRVKPWPTAQGIDSALSAETTMNSSGIRPSDPPVPCAVDAAIETARGKSQGRAEGFEFEASECPFETIEEIATKEPFGSTVGRDREGGQSRIGPRWGWVDSLNEDSEQERTEPPVLHPSPRPPASENAHMWLST